MKYLCAVFQKNDNRVMFDGRSTKVMSGGKKRFDIYLRETTKDIEFIDTSDKDKQEQHKRKCELFLEGYELFAESRKVYTSTTYREHIYYWDDKMTDISDLARIARCKTTSKKKLAELVEVCDVERIVSMIAINPNTSVETLRKIYAKNCSNKLLAKNSNTPSDMLQELYNDNDGSDEYFIYDLLRNSNMPIDILLDRLNNGTEKEKSCVLEHVKLSQEQLDKFLEEGNIKYNAALLMNSNLDDDTIQKIYYNHPRRYYDSILKRENAPIDVLTHIRDNNFCAWWNGGTLQKMLNKYNKEVV